MCGDDIRIGARRVAWRVVLAVPGRGARRPRLRLDRAGPPDRRRVGGARRLRASGRRRARRCRRRGARRSLDGEPRGSAGRSGATGSGHGVPLLRAVGAGCHRRPRLRQHGHGRSDVRTALPRRPRARHVRQPDRASCVLPRLRRRSRRVGGVTTPAAGLAPVHRAVAAERVAGGAVRGRAHRRRPRRDLVVGGGCCLRLARARSDHAAGQPLTVPLSPRGARRRPRGARQLVEPERSRAATDPGARRCARRRA